MKHNKTVLEVLIYARKCVAYGWTQGAYARDARGQSADPRANTARSFCAAGALARSTVNTDLYSAACAALRSAVPFEFGPCFGFISFNETPGRTQAEVLALFDKAIEAEEAK